MIAGTEIATKGTDNCASSGTAGRDVSGEKTVNIYIRMLRKIKTEKLEKCDACKFDYYEKYQVAKHTVKDHEFHLCLQCDSLIKNKNILTSKKFNMREIIRKDFESIGVNVSSAELDRLVKK